MRYVIIIASIAAFIIWDGLYNEGRYLDRSVKGVTAIVHSVTG